MDRRPLVMSLQLQERPHGPYRAAETLEGKIGGGILGDTHVDKPGQGVLIADRAILDKLGMKPGDIGEQITLENLPGVTTLPQGTHIRMGGITLRVNYAGGACTYLGEKLGVDPERLKIQLLDQRGAICTVVATDGPVRVGDVCEVRPPAAEIAPSS